MTKYEITLGDWSDDGHGKTMTTIVDIPDSISVEDLKDSYSKSVEEFGFRLEAIAEEYEDNVVPAVYAENLIAAGFYAENFDILDEGEYAGKYYIGTDGLLELSMFMIGRHIENFTWSSLTETDIPILIGGYNAILEKSTGYGLFYS